MPRQRPLALNSRMVYYPPPLRSGLSNCVYNGLGGFGGMGHCEGLEPACGCEPPGQAGTAMDLAGLIKAHPFLWVIGAFFLGSAMKGGR